MSNQFDGMNKEQLDRLRGQLALNPNPQAKIQLERVIHEIRNRSHKERQR